MELVLSLFPGIDLLGRGFEAEGFSVVRGPDLIYGGNVRSFHVPAGRFQGVIGGPPCQDFSSARRSAPTGEGLAMLAEFARIVEEACPGWWLLENVKATPDVEISDYSRQRLDVDARDFGLRQRRLRHFQFGASDRVLMLDRPATRFKGGEPCAMASEGSRVRKRTFAAFCVAQGLPADFELPGMSKAARYRAVGNGVPIPVARALARAIREAGQVQRMPWEVCACGCGRPVTRRCRYAGAGCRKRAQRQRDGAAPGVRGRVTPEASSSPDDDRASYRSTPDTSEF